MSTPPLTALTNEPTDRLHGSIAQPLGPNIQPAIRGVLNG